MMTEPKPCPFCGNDKKELLSCSGGDDDIVICLDCLAENMRLNCWNTRPIEDALQERIAGLEAENGALREAQRLIPVAERLPEDYKRVLIEFDDGGTSIATHSHIPKQWSTIDKLHFHGDSYNWVVAWRELPDGCK